MQAILEMIVGLILLVAAMTLAPLGIELNADKASEPAEVSRTSDCKDARSPQNFIAAPSDC